MGFGRGKGFTVVAKAVKELWTSFTKGFSPMVEKAPALDTPTFTKSVA